MVAENPLEAGLAKVALEAEGIRVQLRNMDLWGVAVEVLYAEGAAPSVWVPESSAQSARDILKRHAETVLPGKLEKWHCSDCQASNDAHFEICWRCQSEKHRHADEQEG